MAVKTYSPKEISVIVAGTIITGFAEDSFLSIERSSDAFDKVVGADGEVARTASADRSGTITITLLQTSASNDILSALQLADEISLAGKFPVMVKDTLGTSLYLSATAWVQKVSDADYGSSIGEREWVIECADLSALVGGNQT